MVIEIITADLGDNSITNGEGEEGDIADDLGDNSDGENYEQEYSPSPYIFLLP